MQVYDVQAPGTAASEREAQVLDLFRHCFSRDDISLDDDFFELGGDSSLATRILARLYELWGADFQQDILFRCPTPRALAHAHEDDAIAATLSPSLVPLNHVRSGVPIYLVPGTPANPWAFRPLVEQADLGRPVYGMRAPDLDWERDVLSLPELVQHYATEIRSVQRRGPYSIAGDAFGGALAFEIANRLVADGHQIQHLVMFDTAGPMPWWRTATSLTRATHALFRRLCRFGPIGTRVFDALGWPPTRRALWCFDSGPLTARELRSILTVAFPACAKHHDLRPLTFADLYRIAVAQFSDAPSDAEWEQATGHAAPADAVSRLKAHKVWAKNHWLALIHRPRTVFPGTLTIFASESNQHVARWQPFAAQPLDVRRVPTGRSATRTSASFLNVANAAVLARELKRLLD